MLAPAPDKAQATRSVTASLHERRAGGTAPGPGNERQALTGRKTKTPPGQDSTGAQDERAVPLSRDACRQSPPLKRLQLISESRREWSEVIDETLKLCPQCAHEVAKANPDHVHVGRVVARERE